MSAPPTDVRIFLPWNTVFPNFTFNTNTTELNGSFYLMDILIACEGYMGIYKGREHLEKVYMKLRTILVNDHVT